MTMTRNSVLKLMLMASGILLVQGIAISSVTVSNSDPVPGSNLKSIGKINIPQVPEFPKLAARPGKSPSGSSSNNHQNSGHNQQSTASYQQPSSQQSTSPYQTTAQNLIPPFGLPGGLPSTPVVSSGAIPQPEYHEPAAASVHFEESVEEEEEESPEDDQREEHDYSEYATADIVQNEGYHHDSASLQVETTIEAYEPEQPIITSISSHSEPEDLPVQQQQPPQSPEKSQQESAPEFAMPPHVLQILNALGTGGSLAQASKPEKDGGQGYTTANAIGYATGDNATVTASVSNKMEFNTQTVILTESASASASSMSNGTAFSQATLASNNYNQYGPGSGWRNQAKPM